MLHFDPIFADHAILQAGKPVRIYGKGEGAVSVKLAALSQTVLAKDGHWCAEFPAQDYSTICNISATSCGETLTICDITFGDVYLIAGQSNMQFKLFESTSDGDVYECRDIRLFSTERLESNEHFKPRDGWIMCNKDTAPNFSAIGYFLARDLHKRDNRPIGLVSLYQSASVIQSWLSDTALAQLALNIPSKELHWDHHHSDYSKWNGNAVLYNFAFSQAKNFAYKAVIWYQGESNSSEMESRSYDKMLCKMIELWRQDLNDPALPFVIIQIADCDSRNGEAWQRIQAAQETVARNTQNCYLVKCADICETDNIHPPTKHILAKRIADIM